MPAPFFHFRPSLPFGFLFVARTQPFAIQVDSASVHSHSRHHKRC